MIFDEAHQLTDITSRYFSQQLTSRHMLDFARDMALAYRTAVRDMQQLQKSADQLSFRAQDFGLRWVNRGFAVTCAPALAQLMVQRTLVLLDAAFERAALYRVRLKRLKKTSEPRFGYWYECNVRHFVLAALTPLSVNDKLDYFTQCTGLENATSLLLASPFDYAVQALLCVLRFLPEPRDRCAAAI